MFMECIEEQFVHDVLGGILQILTKMTAVRPRNRVTRK